VVRARSSPRAPVSTTHLGAPPRRYQSDDKSFDFVVPAGWTVPEAGFGKAGESPRRFHPEHIFVVKASDKKSAVEVKVDLGYGNSIADLGSPAAAAAKLLPGVPIKSAEKVGGAVRGSSYLLARTEDGRALKAAVVSKRLYTMMGSGPGAEGVLETFQARRVADRTAHHPFHPYAAPRPYQAWPTNIFCQTASNSGTVPATGTCY